MRKKIFNIITRREFSGPTDIGWSDSPVESAVRWPAIKSATTWSYFWKINTLMGMTLSCNCPI